MSEKPVMEDLFQLVTYKRKRKKCKNAKFNKILQDIEYTETFNKEKALRQLQTAKEDLESSDLLSSTLASLREALEYLEHPEIEEIICLGLGNPYEHLISRYQLALLLILSSKYNLKVTVADPFFNSLDRQLFELVNVTVCDENLEGKYQVSKSKVTIFFLPHCTKQLTNNLLYANWSLNLNSCVVIANSFTKIIEDTPKFTIAQSGAYILRIWPYTVELPMINTFKYSDIFSDTAIHIFPSKKLNLIPEDFWENNDEPEYDSDVEFVTNKK